MRIMNIEKKALATNYKYLALVSKLNPDFDIESLDGFTQSTNFCLVGSDGICMWINEVTIQSSPEELAALYARKYLTLDCNSWQILPKICSDNKISIELLIDEIHSGIPGDEPVVEHIIKIGTHVACRYNAGDSPNIDLCSVLYHLALPEANLRQISTNPFSILKQLMSKDDVQYTQIEMTHETKPKIADTYTIHPQLIYIRVADTPAYEGATTNSLLKSFIPKPVIEDEDGDEECPIALLEESKAIQ